MFDSIILAQNIKNYRLARGLAQGELARRMLVSTQSVSKWECGVSTPDIANLCLLSEMLDVSVDMLLGTACDRKKVMIGIDGGGSKTEFVMFTEDGVLLDRLVLGACNPNAIGLKECVALLCRGISELCRDNAEIGGIYVGSAGFLLGDNARDVRSLLKKSYPHVKIKCNTDILNVIASGTEDENCVAAICGTGSTVCAKEGDALTRLTGWGYLLSKSGSGFDIGRDGLYAALAHREGLGEPTVITEKIETVMGGPVIEHFREIYSMGQSYIASFAPIVVSAYGEGDPVACYILTENAKWLAFVISQAINHYRCGNKLILAGGLVSRGSPFLELLTPMLPEGMEVILPEAPQVMGACVLCARMCGADTATIKSKFVEQYSKLVGKRKDKL